ncbi:LSMT-L [Symbiodinium sp. KB8]|nr:LSMT-L [Symbiodinium sp. KB8]
MLRLLHEVLVKAEQSSWLPYISTLPSTFPTLPLWYTEEEKEFLKGTSVDTLLQGAHIASVKDLKAMQSCCEQLDIFTSSPSLDQLRWAASVVASRAFDSSTAGVILAPFADALNHSSAAPHTRMRD